MGQSSFSSGKMSIADTHFSFQVTEGEILFKTYLAKKSH